MLGVKDIGRYLIISDGIYTPEDLIKLIKFNRTLLLSSFRNDEAAVPTIFRIDLLKKTRMLVEEALKNGIKHPEVDKTARLLGLENLAY